METLIFKIATAIFLVGCLSYIVISSTNVTAKTQKNI